MGFEKDLVRFVMRRAPNMVDFDEVLVNIEKQIDEDKEREAIALKNLQKSEAHVKKLEKKKLGDY